MDLDTMYGPLTKPPNEKIEPWEKDPSTTPHSLQILDEKNGVFLAEMLSMTPNCPSSYNLGYERWLKHGGSGPI